MLAKLVALLISPLGTALLLMPLAVLMLLFVRVSPWRRVGAGVAWIAVLWLWLWSTPLASNALRGRLEAATGPPSVDEVVPAEVAVVLGGGVSGPGMPLRKYPDLGSSADRVWHAARLFRAGKCDRICLSGGAVVAGEESEAEAMRGFLLDLGVPDSAIMLESSSTNTLANARFTREKLSGEGVDRIVLVTSALHMHRARRIFEHAGFEVIPAPTDFEVVRTPFAVLDLLPDAGALDGSSRAMKEILGYLLVR